MLVRCVCGAEVSEWAARCPACGADVAGLPLAEAPHSAPGSEDRPMEAAGVAGLPVEDPSPSADDQSFRDDDPGLSSDGVNLALYGWGPEPPALPALRTTPGPPAGDRRRRVGVAVAAVAAVAALTVGAVVASGGLGSGSSAPTRPPQEAAPSATVPVFHFGPGPAAGLPLPLQAAVVAYADAADPLFVMPRTEVSPAVVAVASAALPGSQAVPAGPGGAMVLGTGTHAGRAIYIGRTGTITDVGPADVVVPGADNTVGIGRLSGTSEAIETVAVVRTASTLQFVPGPSLAFGAGDLPVAVLGDGRVAVRTEANDLMIDGPSGSGPVLGPLGSVVAVTGTTLAWTGAAGCDAGGACPLQITNLATGQTRTVAPPPGASGFAVGGAFSPDGATLLAFAVPASPAGAPQATLAPVYVDTSGAAANLVMPGIPTRLVQGVPVGVAWWTADGSWAVYSGLLGTVRSASAQGTVVDLDLPASYSLVVL